MTENCWIFTFGCGQEHAGRYVKIYGTYGEARQKMVEKYGSKWAFQYSLQEWEQWAVKHPMWVETELEVIE